MYPGGGGCSELRLHHCIPAWVIQPDSLKKKEERERERQRQTERERERERERNTQAKNKRQTRFFHCIAVFSPSGEEEVCNVLLSCISWTLSTRAPPVTLEELLLLDAG